MGSAQQNGQTLSFTYQAQNQNPGNAVATNSTFTDKYLVIR